MPVRESSTVSTGGRWTGRVALLLGLRALGTTGGAGGGGGCGSFLRQARLWSAAQAVIICTARRGLCCSLMSRQGKRRFQMPKALSTGFLVLMWAFWYLPRGVLAGPGSARGVIRKKKQA
uniref:Uncharacterized protein n=1 Tax=Ixodes ricinus TaxID=34613 RepID=A0A6B0UMN2_IXORI